MGIHPVKEQIISKLEEEAAGQRDRSIKKLKKHKCVFKKKYTNNNAKNRTNDITCMCVVKIRRGVRQVTVTMSSGLPSIQVYFVHSSLSAAQKVE